MKFILFGLFLVSGSVFSQQNIAPKKFNEKDTLKFDYKFEKPVLPVDTMAISKKDNGIRVLKPVNAEQYYVLQAIPKVKTIDIPNSFRVDSPPALPTSNPKNTVKE